MLSPVPDLSCPRPAPCRGRKGFNIALNLLFAMAFLASTFSILAVSALDEQMAVTLPYDRTTGRSQATSNLELESVKLWDEAQMGDLIAVFSTY